MKVALFSAAAAALLPDAALALHLPAFLEPRQQQQQPRCSLYSGFRDSPSFTSLCKQLPRATRPAIAVVPSASSSSRWIPSISTEHFTFEGGPASTILPINPTAVFSPPPNDPYVMSNYTTSSNAKPTPADVEVNCYLDGSKLPMSECTRTAALTRHHGYTYTPSTSSSARATSSNKAISTSKSTSSSLRSSSSMPASSTPVPSVQAPTSSALPISTGTAPPMPRLPFCWLQCFKTYNATRGALCGNRDVSGCIGATCSPNEAADYYVWLSRFCPAHGAPHITPPSLSPALPSSSSIVLTPAAAPSSSSSSSSIISAAPTSTSCTRTMNLTRHGGYTYPDTLTLMPLTSTSSLGLPASTSSIISSNTTAAECAQPFTVVASGWTLSTSYINSHDCNNITAAEPHRMASSTSAMPSLVTTIQAPPPPFRPVAPEMKYQETTRTTTVVDATMTSIVPCPSDVEPTHQEQKRSAWFMQSPPSPKLCDAGVYCVNSTFVSDAPPSWQWDAVELQHGQTCLEDNVFNTEWMELQCACAGL